MGHFDRGVFEAIAQQMAQTVQEARSRLEPATLIYGRQTTEGLVANRIEPEGLVDRAVTVWAVVNASQQPLAVVTGFSAHPTTLGASNRELSADYPGVLMRALEARWPGAVALFVAGSAADQAPVKHGEGFFSAQALGDQLAEYAIRGIEAAEPIAVRTLRARVEQMPLPPAKLRLGQVSLPHWLSRRFVDEEAVLTAAVVGGLALAGAPCDLSAELGQRLEHAAQARGLRLMVIGFTNDYIGYCLPERLYDREEYEASLAFHGPRAGSLVVERLIGMIDELTANAP